jgi:integrase
MAYIYKRGSKWWCRVKDAGKWVSTATPFGIDDPADERKAKRFADSAQSKLDARRAGGAAISSGPLTVRRYAASWIQKRREADLDWKNDQGRLKHHVLPIIGDLVLANVRAPHIVDLFHKMRFTSERKLAQRSIYNIYSVVSALFRDAALEGLIDASPCILTDAQLGPLLDADPEWRAGSVFTREEAETLSADPRIPVDRQLVYAFGVLAGLRPGEAAALRWRHWDPSVEPLGKLVVTASYNTRKNRIKGTKTDVVRHVPVHPTLAAMLAEWRLSGWGEMMGRDPKPDDLIVPLPPIAAAARRSRKGEAFRSTDYSYKRWAEEDLPMLGWRYREPYATKSTFITLACKDGANPDVIEARVTHTKKTRSAFDGYRRDSQWPETCNEVAKLRVARRARVTGRVTALRTQRNIEGNMVEAAGVEFHYICAPGRSDRGISRTSHSR